jgi:hypothetical protein
MSALRVTERTKIFEVEIVLEDVRPPVRRLIQVPGDASLAVLHEVVQSAMGWTNSHLHEFEIGGERYGMSDPDWNDGGDVADEAKVKLFRLVGVGERLGYVYDFGDNWVHTLTVKEVIAPQPGVRYPRCVSGRGPALRRTWAARGDTTSSRRCWPIRRTPTTTSAPSGRAGPSTRTASSWTRPTRRWTGRPGDR